MSLHVVDANLDGVFDVILLTPGVGGDTVLAVLLGSVSGEFAPPATVNLGLLLNEGAVAAVVGDLNNDGIPDLIFTNSLSLYVWFGTGDGRFGAVTAYGISGLVALTLGDFDGDGDKDILSAASASMIVLTNDGKGAFSPEHTIGIGRFDATTSVVGISASDLNRDGHLDVGFRFEESRSAVRGLGQRDGVIVLAGSRGGTFVSGGEYGGARGVGTATLADLDKDGAPELIVPAQLAEGVRIARNDGFGDFGRFGTSDMFTPATLCLRDFGTVQSTAIPVSMRLWNMPRVRTR